MTTNVTIAQKRAGILAALESLDRADGAGSDLESFDATDLIDGRSEYVALAGSLDLPQLVEEIISAAREASDPRAARSTSLPSVTRLEVITGGTRGLTTWGVKDVRFDLQDAGRTLKLFYSSEIETAQRENPAR